MRPSIKVALAACIGAALIGASLAAKPAAVTSFTVPLSGERQLNFAHPDGGTGDMNGSGSVTLSVDPAHRRVCHDFKITGLSEPLMAHIHMGPSPRNGPPVVTLFTGPGSSMRDCVPSTRS